jgi:hypothetical protein
VWFTKVPVQRIDKGHNNILRDILRERIYYKKKKFLPQNAGKNNLFAQGGILQQKIFQRMEISINTKQRYM